MPSAAMARFYFDEKYTRTDNPSEPESSERGQTVHQVLPLIFLLLSPHHTLVLLVTLDGYPLFSTALGTRTRTFHHFFLKTIDLGGAENLHILHGQAQTNDSFGPCILNSSFVLFCFLYFSFHSSLIVLPPTDWVRRRRRRKVDVTGRGKRRGTSVGIYLGS